MSTNSKLSARSMWLFAFGGAAAGIAGSYATASHGMLVSTGVYFILVAIAAFLSTQRTQASAGGAIGAFLVTGVVAAIAYYMLIGHLFHGAADSVTGADHASAEQAGAVVGTAVGAIVAVVVFVETLVAGIIGALIGAKSR